MISIEEMRKTNPTLKDMPDAELEKVRILLYEMAELALKHYKLNSGRKQEKKQ